MFTLHVFIICKCLCVRFKNHSSATPNENVQAKFKNKMLSCVFPGRFYVHVYSLESLDVLAEN